MINCVAFASKMASTSASYFGDANANQNAASKTIEPTTAVTSRINATPGGAIFPMAKLKMMLRNATTAKMATP